MKKITVHKVGPVRLTSAAAAYFPVLCGGSTGPVNA